ncbi:MAG: tRNA (guanosine(46)-N7)-methyltransferase TrmB [Rickettsiales bacterium]|jgi:tRNA (guanine-N7-)-methyltransferase|nr:tRNA (guanosine(46)-N7)-methyltransferase TrmB [Rickettsiales bacterium]
MPLVNNKENIRSFGRVNGRNVSKIDQNALKNTLTRYSVNFEDVVDLNILFGNNHKNYFEIGCGYGESIAERAKNTPNINYTACETYTKGVANLLGLIEKYELDNIKIFNGDARLLLEKIVDCSIDKVFLLFPDPWPKKKQHKRRIINERFLALIAKKIKSGGELFFVSDINDYIEWVLESVNKSDFFKRNNAVNIETSPEWWIETKYQAKAIAEGRRAKFLSFIR